MLNRTKWSDPVSEAAEARKSAAVSRVGSAALAVRKAKTLSKAASEGESALKVAREILPMISDYPKTLELQLVAARMFEKSRVREDAMAVWRGIHLRWPEAEEPYRMLLRWTVRDQGTQAARALLQERFDRLPDKLGDRLAYARCLIEVRAFEEAAAVYERVLELEPAQEEALTHFVKFSAAQGEPWRAYDALRRAGQHGALPRALERALQEHALNASVLMEELRSDLVEAGEDVAPWEGRRDLVLASSTGAALRDAAIKKAVVSAQLLRAPLERRRPYIGPVVMINSSLATGGAERQFVRVARELHRGFETGAEIGGVPMRGELEVWCRSLVSRPDAAFFAKDLEQEGISVREIRNFAEDKVPTLAAPLAPFSAYEQWLPRDMVWGLQRMCRKFLVTAPEVVSIWQDGMIGVSALAAVLSGVPRVVLHYRGMPPSQRIHMLKPEYEPLYTALLSAPNVGFTANSKASAEAYAQWLGIDPSRFQVIYNGVEAPSTAGDKRDGVRWAEFAMRSGAEQGETLGTVMRFDSNKRPMQWLDVAAQVLSERPQSRFVLVGTGPLWNEAQKYAEALGIAHRCLFVGATPNVGFWLSKCDAKMLLSQSEGLPNALIEAQALGVPVITTPAGGASEALRPGETGILLSRADELDVGEAARAAITLLGEPDLRARMGQAARHFARTQFSTEQMSRSVVAAFAGSELKSPPPVVANETSGEVSLRKLDALAMGYACNRSLSRYAQGAVQEVKNSEAMKLGQTAFRVAGKPLRWPLIWFELLWSKIRGRKRAQEKPRAVPVFRLDRAIATARRATAQHGPEAAYMWAVANVGSARALARVVATIALQCRDSHPALMRALALRVHALFPRESSLSMLAEILREKGWHADADKLLQARATALGRPSLAPKAPTSSNLPRPAAPRSQAPTIAAE
ncbi:MAG: glycosyltransferase [Neomegalonema sp.]|nr:glycosyltransferase [Neomegalonema sp.]